MTNSIQRTGRLVGLGLAAMGAWVLLAAGLYLVSPGLGRAFLVLGAPVSVLVGGLGARRRGMPVGPGQEAGGGAVAASSSGARDGTGRALADLLLGIVGCALLVVDGATPFEVAFLPQGSLFVGVMASVVATLLLAWRAGGGVRGASPALLLLYVGGMAGPRWFSAAECAVLVGAAGAFGVAKGLLEARKQQHLALREAG